MQRGVQGGFCQACHGEKWLLKKMGTGDGVLFYSSKETYGASEPYQKFTAIGKVRNGKAYRVKKNLGFAPYRKNVVFLTAEKVDIHPLLEKLHFVRDTSNWGYPLMNGFLEIDQHDFELIRNPMLSNL